jgi:hypothetical protein
MRLGRASLAGSALVLSALAAGCGTPKEKTAPCKRPTNLSSYASEARQDCGPMAAINVDPDAALAAIDERVE